METIDRKYTRAFLAGDTVGIRELEKCNGPVKGLITYCKSERRWQARSGGVNGKVLYCQHWELRLKRRNPLFILRFQNRSICRTTDRCEESVGSACGTCDAPLSTLGG